MIVISILPEKIILAILFVDFFGANGFELANY
jgi:hypothetical protein